MLTMRGVPRLLLWSMVVAAVPGGAAAQSGATYHFRGGTQHTGPLEGTVWVKGDDARREIESGVGDLPAGRVDIWKDGGKQIFVLDPVNRTYYEERAILRARDLPAVALETLTARRPFRVTGVDTPRIDLRVSPRTEVIDGLTCRSAVLTFSYNLAVALEHADVAMVGRVDGSEDFCVADVTPAVRLPFDHGLALATGHAAVDAAIAERLATVTGFPLARMLTVKRRIDNGEMVSATAAFELSGWRAVEIAADRFVVPAGYRFKEPVIVAPTRK